MNIIIKRQFWSLMIIFSFALSILGQPETKSEFDVKKASDDDLISTVVSGKDRGEVTQSVIEIFKRSEKMLPHLLKLKGNKSQYNGACLGDPEGADTVNGIETIEGSIVTVEVAALYLITAIHYNNLAFATVAYLHGKKRVKNFNFNTSERVKKAWEATEKWYKKLEVHGLQRLREMDEFPFKTTDIQFMRTYPRRDRKDSPYCKNQ